MNRMSALDTASRGTSSSTASGAGASDAWRREMERAQMQSWFMATTAPSHNPLEPARPQGEGSRGASVDGSRPVRSLTILLTWAPARQPEASAGVSARESAQVFDRPTQREVARPTNDPDEDVRTAVPRTVTDPVPYVVQPVGQPSPASTWPAWAKATSADRAKEPSPARSGPYSGEQPVACALNVHVEFDGAWTGVWLAGPQAERLATGHWRSLLPKLRADLQRQGRDLATLTLNGQRVWGRRIDPRSNDHLTEA